MPRAGESRPKQKRLRGSDYLTLDGNKPLNMRISEDQIKSADIHGRFDLLFGPSTLLGDGYPGSHEPRHLGNPFDSFSS